MGNLQEPGTGNLFEDSGEESPWLIDSDLEARIREKAGEYELTPGEVFRLCISRGIENL